MRLLNRLKHYYAYRKWQKCYQVPQHLASIQRHYQHINGFELASIAKKDKPDLSLTYGEIDLESFLALLSLAHPKTHQVFYDLGSGIGKTVISASLVYSFKKAVGIEKLGHLVHVAIQQQKHFAQLPIEWIHDDFHNVCWEHADIIFVNVATFVPDAWDVLCEKLCKSRVPIIITCAKPLPTSQFNVQKTRVKCSWGIVPAYIHIRSR